MKHTRYFATYLDAYNYYPNGVPSTEIALVGDASYIFVSSDNSYSGNVTFFNAGMTNDQIVDTMTEAAYTTGFNGGYSYGYAEGEAAATPPNDYFAVEMTTLTDEASVTISNNGANYIKYSYDKHTWNDIDGSATITFTSTGTKVYIVNSGGWGFELVFNTENNTDVFKISGNIVSTRNGFDYYNVTNCNIDYAFAGIEVKLDASALILPQRGSFMSMFDGSSGLIAAPQIPLTHVGSCYRMFADCSSLVTPPTTMQMDMTSDFTICAEMFYGCTSLTTAPELPATTLGDGCYRQMFQDCSSLTTAPALPATTLASGCYGNMFAGCSSLTTAPALTATTLTEGCYENMFWGCSSLTAAPALTATTLAERCYKGMFQGCSSLTTAPALTATTLAGGCYEEMFKACTSLTTAPALTATTLAGGCYKNMFNGCTALTTAPALPATTLADECYYDMFMGCTALTTAPALPATTLASYCYYEMFSGCSSLTSAPDLLATTVPDQYGGGFCYNYMFAGTAITSLVLLAELSDYIPVDGILSEVTTTGILYKNSNTDASIFNMLPAGWTVQDYVAPAA